MTTFDTDKSTLPRLFASEESMKKPTLTPFIFQRHRTVLVVAVSLLFSCCPNSLAWAACNNDYLGTICTYRFVSTVGKEKSICKHMDGVLNYSFTRFLDRRGLGPAQLKGSGDQLPMAETYPSGADFEVVNWQYPNIFTSDGKTFYRLPVAKVDIDNDGQNETIVQADFNGDGTSLFSYRVFRDGEFDITKTTTEAELSIGQGSKGNYPSFVGEGLWLRIFVYEGTTYLLKYVADVQTPKSARQIAHQKMKVVKYIGGGKVFKDHRTALNIEDICEFRMTRLVEK